MTNSRIAWIVGATGLTGSHTLSALLEDETFSRVVAIVRKPTGVTHPKLEERVIDFEQLSRELHGAPCDVAICCHGTTIKQAGSKESFRHIDFGYSLAFAQSALSAGAKHLIVVTALGADAKSRIFYNRVKGELEDTLATFRYPALTIVRPSLLLGDRKNKRIVEEISAPFSKLLPKSVRGVDTRKLGKLLVKFAREPASGKRIVLSKEIQETAV